MQNRSRLPVSAGLEGKGGADIAFPLHGTVSHGANQGNAAGLQMAADKGIEAIPMGIRNQHMQNGHGVDKIKGTV